MGGRDIDVADAGGVDHGELGLATVLARLLPRPIERGALLFIAVSATVATFAETTVLLVMSLVAIRLTTEAAGSADLPLGLTLDGLATANLILIATGALGFRFLALLANAHVTARLSASMLYLWRRRLFSSFQHAPWEVQAGMDEGYMQTVTQTHVSRVSGMLTQLSSSITSGISFATFVVGALVVSPTVGVAVDGLRHGALFVLLRPLTSIDPTAGDSHGRAAGTEYARLLNEASSMSLEHRVLGSSEAASGYLGEQLVRQTTATRRQMTLQRMTPQLYTTIGYLAILGGLGIAGRLEPDQVAVVGAVVLMMLRSIGFGQTFQATSQALAAAVPFARELLSTVAVLDGASRPYGDRQDPAVESLELRDATLGYQDRPVVTGATVAVDAGESIGIVGPSGGGKSTLALAILGLLPPLDGVYLINGNPSEEYARSWWHASMSFVPQQPVLFDGSVRDNIVCYREGISDDAVEAAARAAHLSAELASWPAGLDHPVGPRGGHLSGGQRQRICIARALVGSPSVLVLDEPTSALDGAAEESITDVLRDLRQTCTLIVIAHRLSTIAFCDRVLRVADGQIVEVGSGADIQAVNVADGAVDLRRSRSPEEVVSHS